MARYQGLYEDARRKLEIYERIRDDASSDKILHAAMTVVNRHGLTQEFVDELTKPWSLDA